MNGAARSANPAEGSTLFSSMLYRPVWPDRSSWSCQRSCRAGRREHRGNMRPGPSAHLHGYSARRLSSGAHSVILGALGNTVGQPPPRRSLMRSQYCPAQVRGPIPHRGVGPSPSRPERVRRTTAGVHLIAANSSTLLRGILRLPQTSPSRRNRAQRLVSYLAKTTPPGNVRVSTRFRFTQLSSALKNGVPPPTRTG